MRKAIVEGGVVTNVIEIDEGAEWTPPDGAILVEAPTASIGDVWDGARFTPPPVPPAPVPQSVSRQQIMAALMIAGLITEAEWLLCYQSGTLPALVAAAIATLPTPEARLVAKVKWVEFGDAHRADAMVALLAAQAGLTDVQVDDLFRTAAAL